MAVRFSIVGDHNGLLRVGAGVVQFVHLRLLTISRALGSERTEDGNVEHSCWHDHLCFEDRTMTNVALQRENAAGYLKASITDLCTKKQRTHETSDVRQTGMIDGST